MSIDINQIVKLYVEDKKSPYEIAEKLGTYPNKIRRILNKLVPIRGKSEAQSTAIETGRKNHPTKGRHRREDEKQAISNKVNQFWASADDQTLDSFKTSCKKAWKERPKREKKETMSAGHTGIRQAATHGSKAEHFVIQFLEELGFAALSHRKDILKNHNLELDIYVPQLSTVIEIDGPSHFLPLWGEESLKRVMAADTEKSGLVIQNGLVMLRVKYLAKNFTKKVQRQLKEKLTEIILKIKDEFPDKNNRFIEIEVG